ncbi:hypothetical protein PHYSODRAFT_488737, partial [Phytophthora sojae]
EETGPSRMNAGPPFESTTFSSWKAFDVYFSSYEAKTCQMFRIRSNKTVKARNKIITQENSTASLIPEAWEYYAKTFECTHAGTYKGRGQGKRPCQQARSLNCKAQINLCVRRPRGQDTIQLYVTKQNVVHNHPLLRETFVQYPKTRLAIPEDVMNTVDILQRSGVKNKRILKYVRENTDCQPFPHDMNMVANMKARESGSSRVAERLHKWMVEFSDEPGNIGRIFIDVQNGKVRNGLLVKFRLAQCFAENRDLYHYADSHDA